MVSAPGGTAYLARRGADWCLSAPDPATADPEIERAAICISARAFDRYGIAVTVGNDDVAVLPPGVPPATISSPNGGPPRTLEVTREGVIVRADLPDGSTIVRRAADGTTREDRIDTPRVRTAPCGDGERHFFGPGQTCRSEGYDGPGR